MQLAVVALAQEVQVVVGGSAQNREDGVAQDSFVHRVPVAEPRVVQQPRQVPDLRVWRGMQRRADEARVLESRVGAAPQPHRVGAELGPQRVDEDLLVLRDRARDGVEFEVVRREHGPVLQLGVEVEPHRRPRRRLQPRPGGRHDRCFRAGPGRELVQLDPVEALHQRVRYGHEALAVEAMPPLLVLVPQQLGNRRPGDRVPDRRFGRAVREGVVDRQQQFRAAVQLPDAVRRGGLTARDHLLGDEREPVLGAGVRLGVERKGRGRWLADDPRAHRVERQELQGGVAFTAGRPHFQVQQRLLGVHEQPEHELALVRNDLSAQLGVPQVEPEIDAGDLALRRQQYAPDRQPRHSPLVPEQRPVVLHLRVVDGEPDGVRTRFAVDRGGQKSVAQERTLVPGARDALPHQVLLTEEPLPVDPRAAPGALDVRVGLDRPTNRQRRERRPRHNPTEQSTPRQIHRTPFRSAAAATKDRRCTYERSL